MHLLPVYLICLLILAGNSGTAAAGDLTYPREKVKKTLETWCDWLVKNRRPDNRFNPNPTSWYQDSYAIRTLVYGYRHIGKPEYLDMAAAYADIFVAQQLPSGGFLVGDARKPVTEWSRQELERQGNLADVGSIVAILPVLYPFVDTERKAIYLGVLKRYCDDFASKYVLESGTMTNGPNFGDAYSVAAGTTGMCFAALYAITGQQWYLEVAKRAAEEQLRHWMDDGRPIFFSSADRFPQIVTGFGDSMYFNEVILWVYHHTTDTAYRDLVRETYRKYIKGTQGLVAALDSAWWPIDMYSVGGRWHASKSAAMPHVLIDYYREMESDESLVLTIDGMMNFLCTEKTWLSIGIMNPARIADRRYEGEFAVAALGFGGITLSEYLETGSAFDVGPTGKPAPRQVNFQPPYLADRYALVPTGYERDTFWPYSPTKEIGWLGKIVGAALQRGLENNLLEDTFAMSREATWELAVPNGNYLVELSAGDAASVRIQHVEVEGKTVIDNEKTTPGQYLRIKGLLVAVNDGKLTVKIGNGFEYTTLNYIRLTPSE
jgi:hypothetical protein